MQQQEAFKIGDTVEVTVLPHKVGSRSGVVTHETPRWGSYSICVQFADWNGGHSGDFGDGRRSCWYFFDRDFGISGLDLITELRRVPPSTVSAPASPPSVMADLRLTPQAKTILGHLKRHPDISPGKALLVYGISRLPSCIHEIRKRAGYDVAREMRKDDQGHKYASYKLATVH